MEKRYCKNAGAVADQTRTGAWGDLLELLPCPVFHFHPKCPGHLARSREGPTLRPGPCPSLLGKHRSTAERGLPVPVREWPAREGRDKILSPLELLPPAPSKTNQLKPAGFNFTLLKTFPWML